MKVLVTGKPTKGAWKVRGEQIGAAISAQVVPLATLADIRAADVVLVVKRVPDELLHDLRRSGRPWVYDIVDAYPQPVAATWSKRYATDWLRNYLARLRPSGVIWPNRRMQEDFGHAAPLNSVVYHHHRPGLARNPIRERITTIGYEGAEAYLEDWRRAVEAECSRRGIRFVINPSQLADLDIVLALRGGMRDGYVMRHWKSNVKLANAHASGTPFIGAPECGYQETGTGCELWAQTPAELSRAIDLLESQAERRAISDRFRASSIPIEAAASQVLEVLRCAAKS